MKKFTQAALAATFLTATLGLAEAADGPRTKAGESMETSSAKKSQRSTMKRSMKSQRRVVAQRSVGAQVAVAPGLGVGVGFGPSYGYGYGPGYAGYGYGGPLGILGLPFAVAGTAIGAAGQIAGGTVGVVTGRPVGFFGAPPVVAQSAPTRVTVRAGAAPANPYANTPYTTLNHPLGWVLAPVSFPAYALYSLAGSFGPAPVLASGTTGVAVTTAAPVRTRAVRARASYGGPVLAAGYDDDGFGYGGSSFFGLGYAGGYGPGYGYGYGPGYGYAAGYGYGPGYGYGNAGLSVGINTGFQDEGVTTRVRTRSASRTTTRARLVAQGGNRGDMMSRTTVGSEPTMTPSQKGRARTDRMKTQ